MTSSAHRSGGGATLQRRNTLGRQRASSSTRPPTQLFFGDTVVLRIASRFHVGAGAGVNVGSNAYLKAEYVHTDNKAF